MLEELYICDTIFKNIFSQFMCLLVAYKVGVFCSITVDI